MSMSDRSQTLLDRLGGPDALQAAIDEMYFRVICDEELLPFFDGVEMKALKAHQARFMAIAFTDIPKDFDVATFMLKAHARLFRLGLSEVHFDLVAGHLVESMLVLGIHQNLIDEVVGIVGPIRAMFKKAAKQHRAQQASKAKTLARAPEHAPKPDHVEDKTEVSVDGASPTRSKISNTRRSFWRMLTCRGNPPSVTYS